MTFHHYYRFRRQDPYTDPDIHVAIVGEVLCAPDYSIHVHSHRGIEFCLVMKGTAAFHTDDGEYLAEAGSLFMSLPGQRHWISTDATDPHQMFYLGFHCPEGSRLQDLYRQILKNPSPIREDAYGMDHAFRLLIREYIFPCEGSDIFISSLYTQLIVSLHRNYCTDHRAIRRDLSSSQKLITGAVTYIEAHWNQPMSLDRMGDVLGYSASHIGRTFKRHMHMSVSQYLTSLRMEKAGRLLREEPETTVASIAERTGFTDSHYFSRKFKEYFGMPCGAYRSHFYTKEIR